MSEGILIAIIGVIGIGIPAYFIYRGQKDASRSQREILVLTLQNQKDMALIAANQYNLSISHDVQTKAVEEYHKEVNGKMTKLLETTEALGVEKGKAEEKENPTGV